MEEKEISYMNVIPLVDVMLVLLAIVLTTSTFIARGTIPLDLPKASKQKGQAAARQTIEIDRRGYIYFNSNPTNLESLKKTIQPVDRDAPILIRADKGIALQSFVDVLDLMKSSGFTKISLQADEVR